MHVYLNTVTGKRITATSLSTIPGNIVARGLSNEFIQLNTIAIEYARLINEFPSSPSICKLNVISAINTLQEHL
ncbi:MAG: hypothetical protein ACMV1B_11670 [Prevotella sp.]